MQTATWHLAILARFRRPIGWFPGRADVLAKTGQYNFLQGQYAEARRLLEAAESELPNDVAVLITLAKLDLNEDRPVDAERRRGFPASDLAWSSPESARSTASA